MRLERIEPDTRGSPPTTQVYAARISSAHAAPALAWLNEHHPLPEHLSHVKRIWRASHDTGFELRLLLGPVDAGADIVESWLLHELLRGTDVQPCVWIALAPLRVPRDRHEYDVWRAGGGRAALWPTAFHEQRSLLAVRAEQDDEAMRVALAVLGTLGLGSHGAPLAVVVDPRLPQWEDSENWTVVCEKDMAQSFLSPLPALNEPAMAVVDAVARAQAEAPAPGAYLCTGCVVLCAHEPSVMGAMALVHARARSVVFVHPDAQRGGVASCMRVQDIPGLNHYYAVYRLVRD